VLIDGESVHMMVDTGATMVSISADVAARLGVASPVFPFTVFTDKRGEVVALYVGELHQAQADLILGVVQNLNEDRLKLPEARRNIAQGLQALAPNQDTLGPNRAG